MLERISGLPPGVDGVRATGKVAKEDYERVFQPMLEEADREGRRLRFLYHFGPGFETFTADGAWADARIGLRTMRRFEGCAIVGDHPWIRRASAVAGFFMPCPVRTFPEAELDDAATWLASLPEGPGVHARLLAETGVLVVEVADPLRSQDFDALAASVDAWLEHHEALRGLVIHAREFPGWENLQGLLHHVRFVREHHRRIGRVALAADAKLAGLVPRIGKHFVAAEIRHFAYDELDAAIAWAAEPTAT